jgi:hypothetical protein
MPPKRKRVGAKENEAEKRQKISGELVDASYQHLNDDISRIIINFLSSFMRDLISLSLSSSSWNTKINNYLNQSIKKFMPVSYKRLSVAQRNADCGGFFKTLNNVSQVQIFAYKIQKEKDDEPRFENTIHIVPWDPTIVVHQSDSCWTIFDLTKDVAVASVEKSRTHDSSHKKVSFNEKHRLLGLYVGTQKNASLRVYSVNKGQVSLKSDVVVHEEDSDDEADILIDDDRMVWILSYRFKCFSIDKNEFVEQDLMDDEFTLLSARQAKKGVDFYYRTEDEENDDVPIKVINSVTKKSKQLLRLPNYDYPPTIDWQKNHIAIESTGSNCSHFYVYSRDSRPKLRLYVSEYNGASINVSPDGTRFSFDLNENSFTLYEITGYRAPGPEDMDEDEAEDEDEEVTEMDRWFQGSNIDGNRFCKKLSTITVINNKKPQSTIGQTEGDEGREMWSYHWASNDIIVGFSADSMAVIDLSTNKTEFESFELPIKAHWVLYGASVTFMNEKTFVVSAYTDEERGEVLFCKITI